MEIKEVLLSIIKCLVDNKDAVSIVQVQSLSEFVFEINVDPKDVGKVIGKSGSNASAIRTIVTSIARKHGKGAIVRFNDNKES